jgi:PAS domain S-box-containing protein
MLFEKMADPVLLLKDNQIINGNEAILKLLAYPNKETFLNQSHWDISPKYQANDGLSSFEKANAMIALSLQLGHHRFDWQYLRYDNVIVLVEVTLTPLYVDDELLIHIAMRDITERKNAEDALLESELRWKFALEGAGDGVWDWNIETDHAVYSTRWKEMLGYTEHDIQPTNQEWQTRIHLDDQAMVAGKMQAYLQGTAPVYRVEYRIKCKDNSYKWILGRGMVVSRDQQGRPLRIIGTHTDITTLKEAELILRTHKEIAEFDVEVKNLALIDNTQKILAEIKRNASLEEKIKKDKRLASVAFESAQSMYITDPQCFFLNINQTFSKVTGYDMAELVGKKASILKSGYHDAKVYEQLWTTLIATGAWSGELWNKKKTGEIHLELVSIVAVVNEQCCVTHYVVTATDISKLNAYEAGLIEAKEKAERFSTLKSQFIASMSHEIRTPMSAIIGFSGLALYQDMPEKVRDYLQNINTASTSLLGILQDILDFTKLEAGRVVIESVPFNVLDLFATIDILFSGAAQQKGLVFTIVHDGNIPLELMGDKFRLQQVLINLVGNAIKFTAQGNVKLEITLQSISLSEVCLLFCVSDTGIGIALEDQDKLFIEFSQVDGSFSRQYGGTGLGLVISKELVELMGGEITVVSARNKGSSFSFALPFTLLKKPVGYMTQLMAINQEVPYK